MAYFKNKGEFAMLLTSLVAGFTMVIGVNAVNSAPSFMLDYYKYVAKDEYAVPKHPRFWDNVLTFYTVVTLVAQCVHEPTNLTSFLCRFSLIFRLEMSTILMLVELFVIIILPHSGCSENSAIAALVLMAYIGGMGRAYYENTGYAMFGPCPSKMLSGLLVGAAFSGVLVSAAQITLLATMSNSYDGVVTQSIIYFCFSIVVILVGGAMLITLLYNPFAKQFIAEFRSRRSVWENIYRPLHHPSGAAEDTWAHTSANEPPLANPAEEDDLVKPHEREDILDGHPDDDVLFDDRMKREERNDPEMEESDEEVESRGMTTSELLQSVPLLPVLQKVWVMMATCVFTFGLTYLLYPGMLLAVDADDKWYTTTVIAVYNTADFLGRVLTFWESLHPSRRTLVLLALSRVVMVPLLVLCATGHIPSHWAAYVFTAVHGLGNGFIGTLTIVFSPFSEGLNSDGECALASQATGVTLLLGCALGSLIQIAEVIPLGG